MNKFFAVILTLILIPAAFSATSLVVEETEKLVVKPKVNDPDNDNIKITYGDPVGPDGEWQTDYGDEGVYRSYVTVSDGESKVTEEVFIMVKRKEEAPVIESSIPNEDQLISETESIEFRVLASDLNEDKLKYKWFLDGKEVSDDDSFRYDTTYKDAGTHRVIIEVSDKVNVVSREWEVVVENFDIEELIDEIEDVEVNEGEEVSLDLIDFDSYGLTYSLSGVLGSDNSWQTGFNDAGEYEVKLRVEGEDFRRDKTVNVKVNNVDRNPEFEEIGNIAVEEGKTLIIVLLAEDVDGDEIVYSAQNLPKGAELTENVFTWKIGNVVKKKGFLGRLLAGFRDNTESFYPKFKIEAGGKEIVQNVVITVKDVNQAPVIEEIEDISIKEGEVMNINANIYDPDGDKVEVNFVGFKDKQVYQTTFDDAGEYFVNISASDGKLTSDRGIIVNVEDVNREPKFGDIPKIRGSEEDNIAVLLEAYDEDGDELFFGVENMPEGAFIEESTFHWSPALDYTHSGQAKTVDLIFTVHDKKNMVKKVIEAEISDKNRAPEIVDGSGVIIAKVGTPVEMFVEAEDEDGDTLTYTWQFDIFEKYKATNLHHRIFTTKGMKVVKVHVSDGTDSVTHVINVNVV